MNDSALDEYWRFRREQKEKLEPLMNRIVELGSLLDITHILCERYKSSNMLYPYLNPFHDRVIAAYDQMLEELKSVLHESLSPEALTKGVETLNKEMLGQKNKLTDDFLTQPFVQYGFDKSLGMPFDFVKHFDVVINSAHSGLERYIVALFDQRQKKAAPEEIENTWNHIKKILERELPRNDLRDYAKSQIKSYTTPSKKDNYGYHPDSAKFTQWLNASKQIHALQKKHSIAERIQQERDDAEFTEVATIIREMNHHDLGTLMGLIAIDQVSTELNEQPRQTVFLGRIWEIFGDELKQDPLKFDRTFFRVIDWLEKESAQNTALALAKIMWAYHTQPSQQRSAQPSS